MRKINVLEFVSLDGVIQDPREPEGDTSGSLAPPAWIASHSDAVSSATVKKQMSMPFDLLLGRRTFELWARFWPQRLEFRPAPASPIHSQTTFCCGSELLTMSL